MNQNDRRVKRTKKSIKTAFIELLKKKSIYDVTVYELAELADISRVAFYSHYKDIYDLQEQMEKELFDDMSKLMVVDNNQPFAEAYKALIDYIYENADVCRILMGRDSDSSFRERLIDIFEVKTMEKIRDEMKLAESREEWEYLNRFICDGTIAVFVKWLESDFSFPKDKLIDLIIAVDKKCFPLYK